MQDADFRAEQPDRTDPLSIYNYSRYLIGESLRSLIGECVDEHIRKGKGGLGQMVEELFFGYDANSKREADFAEAGLELKCTPLTRHKDGDLLRIKERLVCTMIDYAEIAGTKFEDSHLLAKCRIMLLLFYLHISGQQVADSRFIYRVLWQLPKKDLLLISRDYETIAAKVREGKAHLLSEGDTIYLGACRKGQKGDRLQPQPYSDIPAAKRAFSLKPAYMRYILAHVVESGQNHYTNYSKPEKPVFELVEAGQLKVKSFEEIILDRFRPFTGLNYVEICDRLGIEPYQAKSKYADVCGLIASNNAGKRISESEEFIKSGIIMKTVRLGLNGKPRESMSFKNIDYNEVIENEEWTDSELYELFTSRFLFVVFRPVQGVKISIYNRRTSRVCVEQSYVLDEVFFWAMPPEDLERAKEYRDNIRTCVLNNEIRLKSFWSISDQRSFHVRPKATNSQQKTSNPHGGMCDRFCYWFNGDYVHKIIESSTSNVQ